MASVLINEEGFVRVTEMDISANFTSIKLHLDNLLGGGNFGESINNLLNLLGDFIWDQLKDILFPLLESVNQNQSVPLLTVILLLPPGLS